MGKLLRKPWEMDFFQMGQQIKEKYPLQLKEIIDAGYSDLGQYFRTNIKGANDWHDFLQSEKKTVPPVIRGFKYGVETWYSRYYVTDDGYCVAEKAKTIRDVRDYCVKELKKHTFVDVDGDTREVAEEGLSDMSHYMEPEMKLWPLNERIAVFYVTGGSEGHYVHVEALVNGKNLMLFLSKTFQGREGALRIVDALSKILEV